MNSRQIGSGVNDRFRILAPYACLYDTAIIVLIDRKPIWGAQIGYAYNSILGPLGGSLSWSNFTKQLGIYINLGYEF